MTSNLRSRGGGTTQRRPLDPEERFQRRVTLGFIALTIATVVVVVLGLLWQYWDQHLRSVASVGGTSISIDQWRDRTNLEDFRLERQDRWVTEAAAAGELTADQADARHSDIATARSDVASTALESLISLTLQNQLAADRGITTTDADVDAALAEDAQRPETRRVSVIEVMPGADAADPDNLTGADRQQALADARAAQAALVAGTPFAEVAKQYSTADDAASGGDRGIVGRDDTTLDPALLQALFGVAEGEDTPLLQDADGTYLIGRVTGINPPTEDVTYTSDLEERLSAGAHRDNVRLETVAQRLEDGVVADATVGDKPQVHLAEIWLSGDPLASAEDDSGRIHAAHILYAPEDGASSAGSVPDTDPAWTVAQAQAGLTTAELQRITDPTTRANAFMELATQSDDTSNANDGGDLGWFSKDTMVSEFAEPLFEDPASLTPGDIIGPVKTDFGWHVIQFLGYQPPVSQRLVALNDALAADGADFATIAQGMSDGAEGADGGDLGWRLVASLPSEATEAIAALEPGGITAPITEDDGYHVYQLVERADRPLDPAQLATVSSTAFDDWFGPIQDAAEEDGTITRDESVGG
jgi:parvulin-like peptidyl-prolyl isomerase